MVSQDLAAATLGVDRNATESEIRRAYKQLAQVNHPDHGGDPSVMATINEAYGRLLGDDGRAREESDRDIDWQALDADLAFESWEDTMWPEPPPGLGGMWRLLLAVVVLPVAIFALMVLTVVLVVNNVV